MKAEEVRKIKVRYTLSHKIINYINELTDKIYQKKLDKYFNLIIKKIIKNALNGNQSIEYKSKSWSMCRELKHKLEELGYEVEHMEYRVYNNYLYINWN